MYIHTVEYHSALKKNEVMPFEETWIDFRIIILSKSEKYKHHDITYMWNLKYYTNELIYKTETG